MSTSTPKQLLTFNSNPPSIVIYHEFTQKFWIAGSIFNVLFILAYARNFLISNSPVRGSYFFLIAATTLMRIIHFLLNFFRLDAPRYFNELSWLRYDKFFGLFYESIGGQCKHFYGIIIFVLAANRATALLYPIAHREIWKWKNFSIIFALICIWPFIVNLSTVHLWHCCYPTDIDGVYCRENFIGTNKYIQIPNLILPLLALILNYVSIKTYFKKRFTTNTSKHKIEGQLLYQSIFSTVTFLIWTVLGMIDVPITAIAQLDINDQHKILLIHNYVGETATLFGLAYFEGGLIVLLIFSTIIRKTFFDFYGITFALKLFNVA